MGTYIIPRSGTCSIIPRTRINRRTEKFHDQRNSRDQIRKNLEFSLSLSLSLLIFMPVLETRYRRTDIVRINTDKFHATPIRSFPRRYHRNISPERTSFLTTTHRGKNQFSSMRNARKRTRFRSCKAERTRYRMGYRFLPASHIHAIRAVAKEAEPGETVRAFFGRDRARNEIQGA